MKDVLHALSADRSGSYLTSSQYASETAVHIPGGLRGVPMVAVFVVTAVATSTSTGSILLVVASASTSGGTYNIVGYYSLATSTTDSPQTVLVPFVCPDDNEYFKAGAHTFTGTYTSVGIKYKIIYLQKGLAR